MYALETFTVSAPFAENGQPIEVLLPRLKEEDREGVKRAIRRVERIDYSERARVIGSLVNYSPSRQTLESMCRFTGMPIAWISEKIKEGIQLAVGLSKRGLEESPYNNHAFVNITPNDPREFFFFAAHTLMADIPAVIKLSSREPFLGHEVTRHLLESGMPPGYVNILYADSSSRDDSKIVKDMLNDPAAIPIVMGSALLSPRQISFYADHSRGLVLDAAAAIPHLATSIFSPLSCLSEHNHIVVGRENYERIKHEVMSLYSSAITGNLLDEKTTMGKIEETVLSQLIGLIKLGVYSGTMNVIYARSEMPGHGALIEHYSELGTTPNLLMTQSLPAYVTGLRYVPTIEDALRDIARASACLPKLRKSMAIAVYGNNIPGDLTENLKKHAFTVSPNRPCDKVDGIEHQGVNMNHALTRYR